MDIAVVTGASSGMGADFARQISLCRRLDEIWVIARREERLQALKEELKIPVRVLAMDLSREESLKKYKNLLEKEKPCVKVLVNASGFGKFGFYEEIPLEESMGMIDINCKALVAITTLTLPFMKNGGEIYQVDSLSSFQPVPYITVYGATKAFVLSYSRALGAELKERGIRVIAVCPGWVKTEFFSLAEQTNSQAVTYFNRYYMPKDVVLKALRDMKKGKDVSVLGLPVRAQVLAVKLLPHRLVMKIWMNQQKRGRKK